MRLDWLLGTAKHPFDLTNGRTPRLVALDRLKAMLEAHRKFGIGILPVATDQLAQVGEPRSRSLRGSSRAQLVMLADLRDERRMLDRVCGGFFEGLQRHRLALPEEETAGNRAARGDPGPELFLIGMRGVAVDATDARPDRDVLARNPHP